MKQTMKWLFVEEQGNSVVYRCSVCSSEISVKHGEELPYCKHCESEPDGDWVATDNEIIIALNDLIKSTEKFKYGARKKVIVDIEFLKDMLNVTNRQKAEIESITEKFNCQQTVYADLSKIIKDKNTEIEKLREAKEQLEVKSSEEIHSLCAENRTLQNTVKYCEEEIPRLHNILHQFLNEITLWGNKNNVDTTTFSLIPILIGERDNYTKQIKFEAVKEFAERLKERISRYDWLNVDELVKEMVGEG